MLEDRAAGCNAPPDALKKQRTQLTVGPAARKPLCS